MLLKKVVKRGDSHYILIPKNLMDILNISKNDKVLIDFVDGKIIIEPLIKNKKIKGDK